MNLDLVRGKLLKPVDAFSLSFLRIVFFLLMFVEVCSYIYYYALLRQDVPFMTSFNVLEYGSLYVWLGVLLCLSMGLYTSYLSIVNYVFAVYFFGTDVGHWYHVHYIFLSFSTLMVLMPLGRSLSLDSILAKKKGRPMPGVIPAYVYVVYVLFLLAFVYFDSVISKWDSYYWTNGLCLWIGTTYLSTIKHDLSFVVNMKWAMIVGNYASLIFETVFIFLLPWRKMRLLLAMYGATMHFFIAILYPLPIFGIAFTVLYILLVPSSYWRWMFDRIPAKGFAHKFVAFIERLSLPYLPALKVNKKVIWAILAFLFINQAFVTVQPIVKKIRIHLPGAIANASRELYDWYYATGNVERFTGVTDHPLFLDSHFVDRNIFAIYYQYPDGRRVQLPFTDERGLHSSKLQNVGWKLWSLYTISEKTEEDAFVKFSAFWAHRNHVDLENAKFEISYKRIKAPKEWEKDLLKKQIDTPWQPYGELVWKGKQWSYEKK